MEVVQETVPMAAEVDVLAAVVLPVVLVQVLPVVQTLLVRASAMEAVIQNAQDVIRLAKVAAKTTAAVTVLTVAVHLVLVNLINKKKGTYN